MPQTLSALLSFSEDRFLVCTLDCVAGQTSLPVQVDDFDDRPHGGKSVPDPLLGSFSPENEISLFLFTIRISCPVLFAFTAPLVV